MSIILLTNVSDEAHALAHRMRSVGPGLSRVIATEPEPHTAGAIGRFARGTIDWLRMKKVRLDPKVRVALDTEARLRRKAWGELHASHLMTGVRHPLAGVEYTHVSDMNSKEVVDLLERERPELLLVYGTKILREPVLRTARRGVLNAHCSILPEYRGVRSEFWQCHDEAYDHVGITIHLVDIGVDTGMLLFQHRTEIGSGPDPFNLRTRNTLAVIEHYPAVAKAFLAGEILPVPQPQGLTRTFRGTDITLERKVALYGRLAARM
ncbi:MAG: hypothetical protein IPG10_14880 [Flavobacteriales bacterium]|jgi:folate-dependent phosphoribosylglycinamide formyltransferase PurN|nr:hypothetical protein [Flavobacteriales bacterium]MBK6755920.1 hypothetical protein [Flavobacteriales bacterium]MBK7084851.1 hypothetical protein [Flavobacteriales bacterium]MBK7751593.1 hypothetical protein [Flavobacteriales bacterium]MBK9540044.1 hypothetical protein [Flavobacteriales bacterium]